jgi:hypothetical protein
MITNPSLPFQKQFKFAITVMTLLGVAWILGFFLIIQETNFLWLRWLFIIFNSTQVISFHSNFYFRSPFLIIFSDVDCPVFNTQHIRHDLVRWPKILVPAKNFVHMVMFA